MNCETEAFPLSELSFPILGMYCEDCAARVETALNHLPGVLSAAVDLATEKANLNYDATKVDLIEFQHAVEGACFAIPTSVIALRIEGMYCLSCVSRVQSSLKDHVGVFNATVDLANGMAIVTHVPGSVNLSEMEKSVENAGYTARLMDAVDISCAMAKKATRQ